MTPKFGSGSKSKPHLPAKGSAPAAGTPGGPNKGLIRKETHVKSGLAGKTPQGADESDKPVLGDINEPLDEALAEVEVKLAQTPADRELHVRHYKILRKMANRPAMRAALQQAARQCGDPFFGVKLAEALEEEGSYLKALEWRRWVAQFEPDDPDTIRRLAATAVRAGALETAEESYSHLLKVRNKDEAPLGGTFFEEMLGKGLDLETRKSLQKMGLRLLNQALATRKNSPSLLEAAARLAYRAKDFKAAQAAYEKAIHANSKHKNVDQWKSELLRVYAHVGLQDRWRALNESLIKSLSKAVREARGDTRAWNMLANLQIQAGRFEEAITTLKDSLRADSKNAQALWELGRLYVRMGRSQEAVDYYQDIINDPSEKKSVRRAIERALAELYFKLGRYPEALEIYLREEESNIRMIAPIYEAVGELEEAQALYLKSVAQAPRDAKGHLGLAEYWVRRENWPQAAEAAREGLHCTYATEEVHSNLAVALATAQMKMSQVNEALQTMEEICVAYPDSIHQIFRKVKLILLQGRKDEAMRLAEEVRVSAQHQTGCAPSSSTLWTLLGDTCSLLGRIDEAQQAYTQALKYDAMDATAVRGLGILAEKQGTLAQALELYERFVVLDPLNLATPTIRQRIKALQAKGFRRPVQPQEPRPEAEHVGPPPAPVGRPGFPGLPPKPDAAPAAPQSREGWLGDGTMDDWYNTGE
jgi:tetratricopeptide (TPR) repeat protein